MKFAKNENQQVTTLPQKLQPICFAIVLPL